MPSYAKFLKNFYTKKRSIHVKKKTFLTDNISFIDLLMWYWLMMWQHLIASKNANVALTNDVILTKIMYHWLMTWPYIIGPKSLLCVDCWHGSILVDLKTCVQYMHKHGMTTLIMCFIQSELAKWRNLRCPNCFHPTAKIYSLYL